MNDVPPPIRGPGDVFRFDPPRQQNASRHTHVEHDDLGRPKFHFPHPIKSGIDLRYQAREAQYFATPRKVLYVDSDGRQFYDLQYPTSRPPPNQVLPVGYSERPHPGDDGYNRCAWFASQYNHLDGYSYPGQWNIDYLFPARTSPRKSARKTPREIYRPRSNSPQKSQSRSPSKSRKRTQGSQTPLKHTDLKSDLVRSAMRSYEAARWREEDGISTVEAYDALLHERRERETQKQLRPAIKANRNEFQPPSHSNGTSFLESHFKTSGATSDEFLPPPLPPSERVVPLINLTHHPQQRDSAPQVAISSGMPSSSPIVPESSSSSSGAPEMIQGTFTPAPSSTASQSASFSASAPAAPKSGLDAALDKPVNDFLERLRAVPPGQVPPASLTSEYTPPRAPSPAHILRLGGSTNDSGDRILTGRRTAQFPATVAASDESFPSEPGGDTLRAAMEAFGVSDPARLDTQIKQLHQVPTLHEKRQHAGIKQSKRQDFSQPSGSGGTLGSRVWNESARLKMKSDTFALGGHRTVSTDSADDFFAQTQQRRHQRLRRQLESDSFEKLLEIQEEKKQLHESSDIRRLSSTEIGPMRRQLSMDSGGSRRLRDPDEA